MHFSWKTFEMECLSYRVLTGGVAACCVLLIYTLLLLVWTGPVSYAAAPVYAYAAQLQDCAVVLLAAGVFGALGLETLLHP